MEQSKIPQAVQLSEIRNDSWPLSTVVCYEGIYSDAVYKTWEDFIDGIARLRRQIKAVNSEKWLLYCEDNWYFLLAFTSLVQCKKEILLSPNLSPDYIAEIRGDAPLLTDQAFPGWENTFSIPSMLREAAPQTVEEAPRINPDEISIVVYTSGSTGKPKAIKHRLTEFEYDCLLVRTRFGKEYFNRKVCSTVSPYHIYGLLASLLGPFHSGVPFRRNRIESPQELEKFSDTEYMIITVPAFLKRAVEVEKASDLCLKSPYIFASGGVLDPETAKKTSEVFGSWPFEMYGSTETSGVAWRQIKDGPAWTPYDGVQLSKTQDGCLIIRSPFVRDPAGFDTADLVEILPDGRFILKGRLDSIVKIEEKRVSLTEVENRILQSGLAADACVIPMEDRRQYLAAAVVLNDKGKEQFSGLEKHEINKFWRESLLQYLESITIPKKWRYLEALPLDAQGKKKRDDIRLLFSDEHLEEEK